MNSRIRDLSSHEILYSREQNTGSNINLKDEELQTDKMKKKLENHKYSEKSKYPSSKEPIDAKAQKGDLVYLKEESTIYEIPTWLSIPKEKTLRLLKCCIL